MKKYILLLIAVLSTLLLFRTWSIHLTDIQAAWAWNLAMILTPAVVLVAQWRFARERGIPLMTMLTLVAVLNTTLVLGARVLAWNGSDWHHLLTGGGLPDVSGKTALGGFVVAMVVYELLRRHWKVSHSVTDAVFIGFPLAAVVGRIGCTLAGCCHGMPTDGSWGFQYGPGSPAFNHQVAARLIPADAPFSLAVYPVQGFAIVGGLLMFSLLWWSRGRLTRPGSLAFLAMALLFLQRFGLEFFREAATNRGELGVQWGGLKIAQWICLVLVIMALLGFRKVQRGKLAFANSSESSVSGTQQAWVLGSIALLGFLIHDLLTIDEMMLILVSCAPAMVLLAQRLWQQYQEGQAAWGAALMLSGGAIGVLMGPVDSLGLNNPPSVHWKRWTEVGAGGTFGNFKDVSRDCGGQIVSSSKVPYNAAGLDVTRYWMRDRVHFNLGARGAYGAARGGVEGIIIESNYDYFAYGIHGGVQAGWFGIGAGLNNRHYRYSSDVLGPNETIPEVSANLRVGLIPRYSFDIRVNDEPVVPLTNEPVVSIGLVNWGFNDPTGARFMRAGVAYTRERAAAFAFSGRIPLDKNNRWSLQSGIYLGYINQFQVGIKYRMGK